MLSTNDYNKFKFLSGNRAALNPTHIKKMVENLKEYNFTKEAPVVVRKDFTIINGQHRVKACEIAQVPVYYIVSERSLQDEEDLSKVLINSNTNQLLFKSADIISYWAARGHKSYKIIDEVSKSLDIPCSQLNIFAFGNCKFGEGERGFKIGQMEILNVDQFYRECYFWKALCDTIWPYLKVNRTFIKRRSFVRALRDLMRHENFKGDHFLKNAEKWAYDFTPQLNVLGYLKLFCSIYNKHLKHSRISFEDIDTHNRLNESATDQ